jgi:formate-dependent phosphoribosylglycinamide formyltransferase (GAR transformylase)
MPARKKVLIAAANNAEVPILKLLKEVGFDTVTLSNREFDIGHKYSDESVIADYSNAVEIESTFKKMNCDFLIPGSNDFSMIACAEVAEKFNLNGFDSLDVTKKIHYKDKLRNLQKKLSLPHPNFIVIGTDHDLSIPHDKIKKFPVIVKPVDMGGGKGVSICRNYSELEYAVKKVRITSRKEEIIIEEFLVGSYHGISTIIKNKKIIFSCHDDEYYWENKFLVGGTSYPSSMNSVVLQQIKSDIEKIAVELELSDGLLHVQVINLGHSSVISEVTRRTPGDLYLTFADKTSEYDYIPNSIYPYIGKKVKPSKLVDNGDLFYSRICLHPQKNGRIKEIDLTLFDRFIDETFIWMKPGEYIGDCENEKVGIVFFKFNNFTEMKRVISSFSHAEIVIMEDE